MRDLGSHESDGAEAHIVGSLSGVVEWANDAFARLSGIALEETLDKPVGRLLERAGLDRESVELVAQHFFDGQICRVAFPFDRPDGRRIDVVVEVEALRDAIGEIDRFRAIAREAPTAAAAPTVITQSTKPSRRVDGPIRTIGLEDALRRGLEAALAEELGAEPFAEPFAARPAFSVELDLAGDLGPVEVAESVAESVVEGIAKGAAASGTGEVADALAERAVEALVRSLFAAARLAIAESGNAGAVLTVSTARLEPHRRFVSKVHAVAACPPERSAGGDVVVEVHDTAQALPPAVVAALACGEDPPRSSLAESPAASPRLRALAEACRRARALGARVHLDATPGCGNQMLVLFAAAQAR